MISDALLWAMRDAPVQDVEEWAVLVTMAEAADQDGSNAFLSVGTIAETTRMSPDTVSRRQAAMSERGLLARGDQSAAARYGRRQRQPVVYDLQVPYGWFPNPGRINLERARRGLPPLTPEDRPDLPDAPERARRKDYGVPRPKQASELAQEPTPGLDAATSGIYEEPSDPGLDAALESACSGNTLFDQEKTKSRATNLCSSGDERDLGEPEQMTLDGLEPDPPSPAPSPPGPSFEDFWSVYPRKVGKGKARPAWERKAKKVGAQVIMDGAVRYANDPNLPPKGYIPHPERWLNGERWDDEPLPPRSGLGGVNTRAQHFANDAVQHDPSIPFGMPGSDQ